MLLSLFRPQYRNYILYSFNTLPDGYCRASIDMCPLAVAACRGWLDEGFCPILYSFASCSNAACMRRSVSSLPMKADISYMPGPLPSPTKVRRHAFITSPIL